MISTIYFWKDEQLHTYQGDSHTEAIRDTQFTNCYAVDSGNTALDLRYGKYLKTGWKPILLEKFPKEFRTHLLLLGIT